MPSKRIPETLQERLRCPVCHARVRERGQEYECLGAGCAARFPVVDGIPVLINERASVFSIADFVSCRQTFFSDAGDSRLVRTAMRLVPTIGNNYKAKENFLRFGNLLLEQERRPRVLVLGGSIPGEGFESLATNPSFELVETDVSFGPRTMLICDAHDIPFEDETFDGVVVQAVLEHVVDPYRCTEEIHRVLKARGAVYAETPFMQQVHGGRYDFTRFTHLGHRRVFRRFEEIDSGAVAGPGTALAWSHQYFLLSFVSSRPMRALARVAAAFSSFYLKYLDRFLIDKPGALDAASAYYFLGRKGQQPLPDRDLTKLYRGASSWGRSSGL
jgi:SAM-dependent methyltransferase/uncharacterized protein YbaR (Trm112 family)